MKRLFICSAIFAAVIVSSWLSLYSMKDATEQLDSAALACIRSYDTDDGKLFDRIDELMACWGSYNRRVSFITRSSSLEELAVSVSRLNDLVDNQGGDFRSELNAIIFRANVIYENQRPTAQSVF